MSIFAPTPERQLSITAKDRLTQNQLEEISPDLARQIPKDRALHGAPSVDFDALHENTNR